MEPKLGLPGATFLIAGCEEKEKARSV